MPTSHRYFTNTARPSSKARYLRSVFVPGIALLLSALAMSSYSAGSVAVNSAVPAEDYTLFEADPVRPVAVLEQGGLVAVLNTVDDRLELLRQNRKGKLRHCGQLKVGMRPVAVSIIRESAHEAELWITNHLSDSVSVVRVEHRTCGAEIIDTLHVGDEPRDIVMAHTAAGESRVFVATAHRGQHHPLPTAQSGEDLFTRPADKEQDGLADVFVFDPKRRHETPRVVNLFTDVPRALAVGKGVVYAAGFRTGNRTSVVHAERVALKGLASLDTLLEKDPQGRPVEVMGHLRLSPDAIGQRIVGGSPAVVGQGRCLPDPRPERQQRLEFLQLCVHTDEQGRALEIIEQVEGVVTEQCQCTSGDGALQPTTSLVVQFYASKNACGQDYHLFPDGSRGCWLDANPRGVETPARHADAISPPVAWNEDVKLSLPDQDVFAIDVNDLEVKRAYAGVGTVLFGMAVQPGTGKVFVTNTDAVNLTRFEGHGEHSSTTVRGHLHESHITVIDPNQNRVRPVHLNDHINYSRCCERVYPENEWSFAFPTAGVFSRNGKQFYFTALGSNKVGIVHARSVGRHFSQAEARHQGHLREVRFGDDFERPAGPVGLALDEKRGLLYVKTHFTNELVVVHPEKGRIVQRISLPSPEPESITRGRHVMYNARLTSSHGDSACASCHVFGDLDQLSWDLGDPEGATVFNPGPYTVAGEITVLQSLASDPFRLALSSQAPDPNFRSNKGPMTTQTLRGMANHGAMHWRGDRTRNFQAEPGRQPNFGSLDEDNSFGEFDVAIAGLNGNDRDLEPEVFQSFTHFALQLTLPPNPVRALNNRLTEDQAAARALYFGCASMTDDQYAARQCVGQSGQLVNIEAETQACACFDNLFLGPLRGVGGIQPAVFLLQGIALDPATRSSLLALASNTESLPETAQPELTILVETLEKSLESLTEVDTSLSRGLFNLEAATVAAAVSDTLLKVVALHESHQSAGSNALLEGLAQLLEDASPGVPLGQPAVLRASLGGILTLSNLNIVVQQDESRRGTAAFRNLLGGCAADALPSCDLRSTDTVLTCHGCHTLDPRGNEEFGVYRPGFFGTSGAYSFEAESQIFKIPHLRNAYQKTGMFGMPRVPLFRDAPALGDRSGGFSAADTPFQGPQVRGFGFLHDGSTDTVHRFVGAELFVKDAANERGIDANLPTPDRQEACVPIFRSASLLDIESVTDDPALRSALELCPDSGQVPQTCFLEPDALACQDALIALAIELDRPALVDEFPLIRGMCFQFGSMLEGGSEKGSCASERLVARDQMEKFVLAFDTNLKPMVGQQLTLKGNHSPTMLTDILNAANEGACDLAARAGGKGYLIIEPNPAKSAFSLLEGADGKLLRLARLSKTEGPITLTCYPPAPGAAEARRSAFDRPDSPLR